MSENNLPDQIAYHTTSHIYFKQRSVPRMMAVYRTVGCEYDKHGRGCTMCNFSQYRNLSVTHDHLMAQHRFVCTLLDKSCTTHFDFLTIGNFFNDREIMAQTRFEMLSQLRDIRTLERVLVESRRNYINVSKLLEAKNALGPDINLEFAIGYETSNPFIRNKILNKAFPERHLEDTFQMCAQAGIECCVYLLIKPMTLDDNSALFDAVSSGVHVLRVAQKHGVVVRLAFEPVFIVGETLELAFKSGMYSPPSLWLVMAVLKTLQHIMTEYNLKGTVFVGLSDENLSKGQFAAGCEVCDWKLREQIERFNETQQLESFYFIDCDCVKLFRCCYRVC